MFMNNNKKCIVCGKNPEQGKSSIIINGKHAPVKVPLIKHHVSYNPELIAFVHFNCHIEIHAGKHPHLIQYQEGESREYYDKKQNITI